MCVIHCPAAHVCVLPLYYHYDYLIHAYIYSTCMYMCTLYVIQDISCTVRHICIYIYACMLIHVGPLPGPGRPTGPLHGVAGL